MKPPNPIPRSKDEAITVSIYDSSPKLRPDKSLISLIEMGVRNGLSDHYAVRTDSLAGNMWTSIDDHELSRNILDNALDSRVKKFYLLKGFRKRLRNQGAVSYDLCDQPTK